MDNENQQVPPVPSEPSVKSANNLSFLKALSYGFVIVSIGVLIAVGGYLFGANKTKTPAVSPTPLPAGASAKEGDPTANWKTFFNETLNYEIKYPNTATGFSSDSQFAIDLNVNYISTAQGETRRMPFSVKIMEILNPDKKDFSEFFKDYSNTQIVYKDLNYSQEIVVKRYAAFRNNSLVAPSGAKFLQVFVQSPDKSRYIVQALFPYDSQKPYENQDRALVLFNQILSTFKFTN